MKTTKILIGLLLVLLVNIQCSEDDGNNNPMMQATNPPIADFDALATTIRVGTRVQFVNNSTIATSFQWTFPGGTPASSTEGEPLIQYEAVGTYNVTLTAINPDGEDTLTRENFVNVVDPPTEEAVYTVTFNGNWSAASHPTDFPANDHFSAAIGMIHNANISLAEEGTLATIGIKNMAETGNNTALRPEIEAFVSSGDALSLIEESGLSGGTESISFDISVSIDHHRVSMVSMIAPSPDWFIAVTNVLLYENGNFLENLTVEATAYDSGTDSGNTFTSGDMVTDPAVFIEAISQPPLGDGVTVSPSLASFTFVKK